MRGTAPVWHNKIGRNDLFAVSLISVITFAYVVLRAYAVPLIQDEGNSFWFYAHTGEFLPFHSHLDAGNHFLSSLTGVIGFRLFGYSAIGLRWGSVISFPIYAYGCWCLVRGFSRPVRYVTLLALLWCPFLLDYFSLFRGYGLAMAGWVWALYAFLSLARDGAPRHFALLVLSASLALFADLSLLPACAILLGISLLLMLPHAKSYRGTQYRSAGISTLIMLAVLVYASSIALDLNARGLLYHGSGSGFMHVTVNSLVVAVFNVPVSMPWTWALTMPVLFACGVAVWAARLPKQRRSPIVMLALLLSMELAARQLMYHLLGTNFAQDRAALHLLPLCILLFAQAADTLEHHDRRWALMAALLLVFPVRTLCSLNTQTAMNNGEPTMPPRFIEAVDRLQARTDRPLMLAGSGQFVPIWAFYGSARGGGHVPMRPDPLPEDPDDARVVVRGSSKAMGIGFHIVDSSAVSGVFLLFRDRPVQLLPWRDTMLSSIRTREEFIGLPSLLEADTLDRCLNFSAMATAVDPPFGVSLVTEVVDSTGTLIRYDAVDLSNWPQLGSGEQLELTRFLPAPPLGGRRKVYLWNTKQADLHLEGTRLQVFGVRH